MPGPVSDYLAKLDAPQRKALERIEKAVLAVAPEAEEAVSYGMPAFKLKGKAIAGFAAFKDHLSFFPMSGTVLDGFADELSGYKTSKGTVQFTLDKPLPAPLLKRILKARIAEVTGQT